MTDAGLGKNKTRQVTTNNVQVQITNMHKYSIYI